ncbi:MAG: 4-(cytidine 5'-diphospho)-2-C-methyl-D-erythritol kinase [Hyphomicrobiaceae bacterium]
MIGIIETARAKVNLTLRILGKRPDGYHELQSLVAFAGCGDRLSLVDRCRSIALERRGQDRASVVRRVTGRFASDLDGPNLIDKAAVALSSAAAAADLSDLVLPIIELEKSLPVAAGLGGGSADAAAYLRLAAAIDPRLGEGNLLLTAAAAVGADVSVCLTARCSAMSGIGETVRPLDFEIQVPAVLVNPLVPVPPTKTRDVFRALSAPPVAERRARQPLAWVPGSFEEAIRDIRSGANDLAAAATTVVPAIGDVIIGLRRCAAAEVVRLSGAGPTVFALFATEADAQHAAMVIKRDYPHWWVAPTTLT